MEVSPFCSSLDLSCTILIAYIPWAPPPNLHLVFRWPKPIFVFMVLGAHGILLYYTYYCVCLRKHNVLSMFVFEVVMVGPSELFFTLACIDQEKNRRCRSLLRSGKLMSHPTCFPSLPKFSKYLVSRFFGHPKGLVRSQEVFVVPNIYS